MVYRYVLEVPAEISDISFNVECPDSGYVYGAVGIRNSLKQHRVSYAATKLLHGNGIPSLYTMMFENADYDETRRPATASKKILQLCK